MASYADLKTCAGPDISTGLQKRIQQHGKIGERHALPDHFSWIDGLRGLAALAVVIFHYRHFYLANAADHHGIPRSDTFPWSGIVGSLYDHGGSAVQLFWVISGFVFAHVYLNRSTTLREFLVARIARLYPLHFATLMIVAGVQLASQFWFGHWQIYGNNDWRHFGLQLFMSSNWTGLSRGLSFNGPIWSVSMEIVAYGLFFVALPVIRRFGLIASIALAALMWWVGLDQNLQIPAIRRGAFICAGYFFLGNSVYLILRAQGPRLGIIGALIMTCLALWYLGYWRGIEHLVQVSASIVALCSVALVDLIWRRPTLAWLKRLGDMSYSMYLVHVPLQMLILIVADSAFAGSRTFAGFALTLPLYLLVTIVIADISYRRFEVPMSRFLRRKI